MPVIKSNIISTTLRNNLHKSNFKSNLNKINLVFDNDIACFSQPVKKIKTPSKEDLIEKFKKISICNHSGFADLSANELEACKAYDIFLISLLKSGCKFDEYPITLFSNYWGGPGWNINFEKLGKNISRHSLLKNSTYFKKHPEEMEKIIFKQYMPQEEIDMFKVMQDKKFPRKGLIDVCKSGYFEDAINFYKKFHKKVCYGDLIRLSNERCPIYKYSKKLLLSDDDIVNLSAKNTKFDRMGIGEPSIQLTFKDGHIENHYLKTNYDSPEGFEVTKKELIYQKKGLITVKTLNSNLEVINETTFKKGRNPFSFKSLTLKTKDFYQSWEPSEIKGNYNIYHHDNNGKKYLIGLAEINQETGARHIEKDLTSFDGTKTHCVYSDKPNGDKFMFYQIKDSSGKILLQETSSTKFLSENHCISRRNAERYDIKYLKDRIVITRLQNGQLGDEVKEFVIGEDFDAGLKNVLKQMSGQELFNLKKSGIKSLIFTQNSSNAFCKDNCISIGDAYANNLYVLEHELGHAKDRYISGGRTALGLNSDLVDVFEVEQNLLFDNMSRTQSAYIDYLVAKFTEKDSLGGSLREALCDAQASVETPAFDEKLASRSILSQQFLPRTFAKTIELLKTLGSFYS